MLTGKPPPTVSWFVNDKLQDNLIPLEEEQRSSGIIVNRLSLHDVRRRHLHNTFKCQASNTKLMLPTERTVRLDLYSNPLVVKPLSVRLLEKPHALQAGEPYTAVCEARGSRPMAVISWWKDNRKLIRGLESGNETVAQSMLEFVPKPEDDGQQLKCHAENPSVPSSGLEDAWTLNVV
ncbi:hypothetical protein B566_EDAN011152, partial [Ephemera danica]